MVHFLSFVSFFGKNCYLIFFLSFGQTHKHQENSELRFCVGAIIPKFQIRKHHTEIPITNSFYD